MRNKQITRQWKILFILNSTISGRSIEYLCKRFNCSRRTIYRDLDCLQAAGFPLRNETDKYRENKWLLLPSKFCTKIINSKSVGE